jgi:predicted nucleic acid-binding protein
MNGPRFIDTNILLYSISRDPGERDIAIALLDAEALSVQVLQEFYVQATRATRPDALAHEIAVGLVRTCSASRCRRSHYPYMA